MITKKITTCLTVLCLALLLMSSCSNSTDTKELAEESNDEKFDRKGEKAADQLVDAYSGNLYEVKVSENASLNAVDPEVKKIAAMMVDAHSKMNVDIATLASQKNITLPSDLTDDQRNRIEKLTEKTGLDYDKEYISEMKDKHEKTIKRLERASEKCEDPEVQTWATNILPEVRHHLDMINTAHENLKNRN